MDNREQHRPSRSSVIVWLTASFVAHASGASTMVFASQALYERCLSICMSKSFAARSGLILRIKGKTQLPRVHLQFAVPLLGDSLGAIPRRQSGALVLVR